MTLGQDSSEPAKGRLGSDCLRKCIYFSRYPLLLILGFIKLLSLYTKEKSSFSLMNMSRILPFLTTLPTLFTFIAVILINIGGVSNFGAGYSNPRNTALHLVTVSSLTGSSQTTLIPSQWNYSINPQDERHSIYTATVYLNRQCTGGYANLAVARGVSMIEQCPRWALREVSDTSSALFPNALLSNLRPFNFDTVNLNAPFGLYVTTGIFAFLSFMVSLFGSISSSDGKGSRIFGSAFSIVHLLVVLVLIILMVMIVGIHLRSRCLSGCDETINWSQEPDPR